VPGSPPPQAETIPIYIWEDVKWLAFEDVIDWETIALVVHRRDMAKIKDLVEQVRGGSHHQEGFIRLACDWRLRSVGL
jgi:hypothetical protein